MTEATELAELHQLIDSLRRCVNSLHHRYRENPAMRRVLIDTERIIGDLEILEVDAVELDDGSHPETAPAQKIPVPDTPYDREFWRDVDDEGVGGHFRR